MKPFSTLALLLLGPVVLLPSCGSSRERASAESAPTVESEEPAVRFVAVANEDGETATFTLENRTGRPIGFWGFSQSMPQLWVERQNDEEWEQTGWDWCGTGIEERELAPGAAVSFERSFRGDDRPLRLATHVFEPGRTDASEKIWSTPVSPRD